MIQRKSPWQSLLNSQVLWLLSPILAATLFFLLDLLTGQAIVSADTTNVHYLLRRFQVDAFSQWGSFPLWNEGLLSGIPQIGDPQLGLWSPFILLYGLFDGYRAHQIYMLCMLCVGGLGMALFLDQLIKNRRLAGTLAIAYLFSGVTLSYLYNSIYLTGLCVFPWVLWRYLKLRRAPGLGNAVLLALSIAWVAIEGDPLGCFFMSGYVVIDAGIQSIRQKNRTFLDVLGAGFLALGLSAIVVLPPFDTLRETTRASGISFEEATCYSMPPAQFLTLLLPSWWGYHRDLSFWGQTLVSENHPFAPRFWLESIYLSIPLLVMAGLGIFRIFKDKRERILPGFALLLILMAFGSHFFLYGGLYELSPPFRNLRFPSKFYGYANLFLFAIVALGAAQLTHLRIKSQKTILLITSGLFLVSALFIALFSPAPSEMSSLHGHLSLDLLAANLRSAMALGLSLLLLLGLLHLRQSTSTRSIPVALLVVALFDLLLWAPPRMPEPIAHLDRPSPVAGLIQPGGEKAFQKKLARDDLLNRHPGRVRTRLARESLKPNWGLADKVRHVFGYEAIVPARLFDLDGKSLFERFDIWGPILGVTHLASTIQPRPNALQRFIDAGDLRERARSPALNLVLYENRLGPRRYDWFSRVEVAQSRAEALQKVLALKATPRPPAVVEKTEQILDGQLFRGAELLQPKTARSTWGEQPSIEFSRSGPNHRSFRIHSARAGLLVLKENFHIGWRARLDGLKVPIIRADYLNMGVWLPAGSRQLEMEFLPRSFVVGRMISLGCLGLVILFFLGRLLHRLLGKTGAD